MNAFKPPSPPPRGGAGWAEVLRRLSGRLSDLIARRRLGKCFKRLKYEQLRVVDFPRFYLITKCEEFEAFNPDWRYVVFLFHLHHTSIGPGDHLVVHFLRWLRG